MRNWVVAIALVASSFPALADERSEIANLKKRVAVLEESLKANVLIVEAKTDELVRDCSEGQGGFCLERASRFCNNYEPRYGAGFIIGWANGKHVTIACVGRKF